MKYIKDYKDGDRVFDIYLCKHKQSAVTKNGKPYENLILQDKTGTIDAKIWDPNNAGIAEFDTLDYIEVYGDITSFQGALQEIRGISQRFYVGAAGSVCTRGGQRHLRGYGGTAIRLSESGRGP